MRPQAHPSNGQETAVGTTCNGDGWSIHAVPCLTTLPGSWGAEAGIEPRRKATAGAAGGRWAGHGGRPRRPAHCDPQAHCKRIRGLRGVQAGALGHQIRVSQGASAQHGFPLPNSASRRRQRPVRCSQVPSEPPQQTQPRCRPLCAAPRPPLCAPPVSARPAALAGHPGHHLNPVHASPMPAVAAKPQQRAARAARPVVCR